MKHLSIGVAGFSGWALGLAVLLSAGTASPAAAAPTLGQGMDRAEVAARPSAAHLAEPLVATGPTERGEDAALLRAERWDGRTSADDFSSLTGFLAAYPHSAWRVAVLTDLGISYLHLGYFSRALDAWGEAWHGGRDAPGVVGPAPRAASGGATRRQPSAFTAATLARKGPLASASSAAGVTHNG